MRAQSDAILGLGTVLVDDPDLTCRLPAMETRSPFALCRYAAVHSPQRQAGENRTAVRLVAIHRKACWAAITVIDCKQNSAWLRLSLQLPADAA